MPNPSDTLRTTLQRAINSRLATLHNGRCRRTDISATRNSIALAEEFLSSYPVADDARVKQWCVDHLAHVIRIVPASQPGVLKSLTR